MASPQRKKTSDGIYFNKFNFVHVFELSFPRLSFTIFCKAKSREILTQGMHKEMKPPSIKYLVNNAGLSMQAH